MGILISRICRSSSYTLTIPVLTPGIFAWVNQQLVALLEGGILIYGFSMNEVTCMNKQLIVVHFCLYIYIYIIAMPGNDCLHAMLLPSHCEETFHSGISHCINGSIQKLFAQLLLVVRPVFNKGCQLYFASLIFIVYPLLDLNVQKTVRFCSSQQVPSATSPGALRSHTVGLSPLSHPQFKKRLGPHPEPRYWAARALTMIDSTPFSQAVHDPILIKSFGFAPHLDYQLFMIAMVVIIPI